MNNTDTGEQAMNQTEIDTDIRERWAQWLDDEWGNDIGADEIIITRDALDDLRGGLMAWRNRHDETFDGMPVMIFREFQRRKGDARRDMFILDALDRRFVAVV